MGLEPWGGGGGGQEMGCLPDSGAMREIQKPDSFAWSA